MFQVKSFAITDDKAMNEFLRKYRIAQGAQILISNGTVCIPYDDGEPLTKEHRAAAIGEQRNTITQQMEIIEHSQAVLRLLTKDAHSKVKEAEANLASAKNGERSKDKYEGVKACEKKLTEAQGALDQLENQYKQNKVELTRLQLNVELFDEQIDGILSEPNQLPAAS